MITEPCTIIGSTYKNYFCLVKNFPTQGVHIRILFVVKNFTQNIFICKLFFPTFEATIVPFLENVTHSYKNNTMAFVV